MLRFLGYRLELFVDAVLERNDGPRICSARDEVGGRWLIVQVENGPERQAWLCSPVSERALRALAEGKADPADVVCHAPTGTVELVTIDRGRPVPDRCLLC